MKKVTEKSLNRLESIILGALLLILLAYAVTSCKTAKAGQSMREEEREHPRKTVSL